MQIKDCQTINAKDNKSVPRILPSASGWRANPSTAWAAAAPCPMPGPMAAKPIAKPAAITDAPEIIA